MCSIYSGNQDTDNCPTQPHWGVVYMVHSVCTADRSGELSHFQRLCRVLLVSDVDLGSRLERLFAEETAEFGLEYAFLSRIDLEAERQHFETVHGEHEVLSPETTVPLSETYCRKTIADPEGTMVVSDAPAEGWADDVAYEKYGLGSYLGTTVTVEGKLYGTLCFVNSDPRENPFTRGEKTLVDIYGQWVSYELNRWSGPPTHNSVSVDTVESPISPTQIDSMMEALRSQERRLVLLHLLNGARENSVEDLERTMTDENAGTKLYHTYLPKLEQADYIEWDPDSNTVSRGPKFHEVEPLVQLLADYTAGVPG